MSELKTGSASVASHVAAVAMLIRRPVDVVFQAFVDPAITTHFWFTRGSGRLVEGATVTWEWEMYAASADVTIKTIEQNRRIVIEWPGMHGPTTVEWTFAPQGDSATFVTISNAGFTGSDDEIVSQVIDSTEGFAIVLAGLKAYLEHDIELNLVRDRFPKDPQG